MLAALVVSGITLFVMGPGEPLGVLLFAEMEGCEFDIRRAEYQEQD